MIPTMKGYDSTGEPTVSPDMREHFANEDRLRDFELDYLINSGYGLMAQDRIPQSVLREAREWALEQVKEKG